MGILQRDGKEYYFGSDPKDLYEKSGYYNEGDLQNLLSQGYVGRTGTKGTTYTYLTNPTTRTALRVKPGSGTTAASRAAARTAGDTTLGYKDPTSAKIATATETGTDQIQVSPEQVKALQAAGEEVPQGAQDVLAGREAEGYVAQDQNQAPGAAQGAQ